MNTYIAIGLHNGEITNISTTFMPSDEVDRHFPIGTVYRYAYETKGYMWRVLQRGKMVTQSTGFYAQLLPIDAGDVPEIVRMIALLCD